MYRRFHGEDSGQTIVLVALMFTLLLGFGALSLDLGRFYAERRFTQTAVDAAALACARAYAQSGSTTTAWQAADAVLTGKNLAWDPLGISVTYPAQGSEVYHLNIVAPQNLEAGILPTNVGGTGCRVAVTVNVPTYMIKVLNPGMGTIPMVTRAYAKAKGGFLPSVVQRYANPPGPGNGNVNQFIDHLMAENFDYQCTSTSSAGCTVASQAQPGRPFVIFGQEAKATNDSSFRGYIGLDIRDFTTIDFGGNLIHDAYNGVAPTVTLNTLKAFESTWILEGYPGPDICIVASGSFLPCAQISVLNGSNSGIFVEDYEDRFRVGDKLMLQMYDGTVKTVPDFALTSGTLTLLSTGTQNSQVNYTTSPQFEDSGATITSTLIPDDGTMTDDGGGTPTVNPFLNGCATQGTFSANPTPGGFSSYTQAWNGITTSGCDRGIYQAWIRGTSSAPYTNRIHEVLVNINVDNQTKDYSLDTSDAYVAIPAVGTQADYTIRVTTASGGSTKWTGSNLLTLSWAKCPTTTSQTILPPEVLVCGIDGSFITTSIGAVDPGENHVFNVRTTLARDGEIYRGWVRATGVDENNKRVTHMLEVVLEVNVSAGGVTQYVDVLGYAVFEITAVNSNDVTGKAITGNYLDPNDPALAIAKKWVLVPWETP